MPQVRGLSDEAHRHVQLRTTIGEGKAKQLADHLFVVRLLFVERLGQDRQLRLGQADAQLDTREQLGSRLLVLGAIHVAHGE